MMIQGAANTAHAQDFNKQFIRDNCYIISSIHQSHPLIRYKSFGDEE